MSKKIIQTNENDSIENLIVSELTGKKCWRVEAGGFSDFTMVLDFGDKVYDPVLDKASKYHKQKGLYLSGDDFKYEGEIWLGVWCSWRFLINDIPIISSDAKYDQIEKELSILYDKPVQNVEIYDVIKDIKIKFIDNMVLEIFCDHVGKEVVFDSNWDIKIKKIVYRVTNLNEWVYEATT